ncbi:hypothetical protein HAN_3g477 (nucleomorph) [Hemiselmis andersenii]|uniref:Uncharacterized protein n=1 Tax=Hemiselmis andersenii TaxID=464988 RepID=A9BL96_HEMAN|nr:hypothetical protein HAN_3g477 [Hemiselmis andersenii]ABW98279.1 hypothetical protein HAN_3g477 [Hemiselmis andersenii]
MEIFLEIEIKLIAQWACYQENFKFSLFFNKKKNLDFLSKKIKDLCKKKSKKFKKKTCKFFFIRQNFEKKKKKKISKKFSIFILLFENFCFKKRSDCEITLEVFSFRNYFQTIIFSFFIKKINKKEGEGLPKILNSKRLFFFIYKSKFLKKDNDFFLKIKKFSFLRKNFNFWKIVSKKKTCKLFFHFFFNFKSRGGKNFQLKKIKKTSFKRKKNFNLSSSFLRLIFEKFNLKISIILQTGSLALFSIGKIFLNSNFNFSKFPKFSRFSNKIKYFQIKNFSNVIFKESLNKVFKKFLVFFTIFICPLQKIQNESILFFFPCCHLFSGRSFMEKKDLSFFKFFKICKFKKCPCCNFSKKFFNRISFLY